MTATTTSSSDSEDEAAAAAVAEEEAPECAGTYTVVAGDYWIRFVDSSGATLDEWLAANDAAPDTELHVGDELCIPAGAQAPTPTVAETAPPEPATPATEAAQVPAPTAPPETSPPPPPPPPVETAAPAPVENRRTGRVATTDEVQAMIREIWPDDIEERALQIAYNEAKWRPDLNNWCCYGVFALYFDVRPGGPQGALRRRRAGGPLRRADEHQHRLRDLPAVRLGPVVADRPRRLNLVPLHGAARLH